MMNLGHILTCALLIPAGLLGIGTGLHEIIVAFDGLPGLLAFFGQISQQIQPWAEGLACLIFGLILLIAASAMAVRGLQS